MRYGWSVDWITRSEKKHSFQTESRDEADRKAAERKKAGCRNIKISQCIF